jgi:hypothetical protein
MAQCRQKAIWNTGRRLFVNREPASALGATMTLVHHFPDQANTINAWIAKSGFDPNEENSVRLALELGSKPLPDKPDAVYATLNAAWKRVQAKPVPAANVDATAYSGAPALALAEALRAKIGPALAGVPRGQLLNALNTFLRVGMPWLYFEGR